MATDKKYVDVNDIQEISKDYTKKLKGKVDTETGKGLSEKDFTAAQETKLNGIETGAQVNEITEANLDSKVGALDYLKEEDIEDTYAKSANIESTYVKKEGDKGLSTNDYDNTEKAKVAGAVQESELESKLAGLGFIDSEDIDEKFVEEIGKLGNLLKFAKEPIITKSQMATLKTTAEKYTAYLVSDDNNHVVYFLGTDVSGTDENGFLDTGFHLDVENLMEQIPTATTAEVQAKIQAGVTAANAE